jgi:hypothetical protein
MQCLITGCKSNNDSKGIKDILDFYGGTITWSKSFSASTEKDQSSTDKDPSDAEKEPSREKHFLLAINAPSIQKHFEATDLPASNCAYLFYRSLSDVEKRDYAFIRVVIQGKAGNDKYDFAMKDLYRAEKCLPTLDKTVQCLKEENLENLRALFSPMVPMDSLDKEKMRQSVFIVDSTYGRIKNFVLQGFSAASYEIGCKTISLIKVSGNLVREKQNTLFSVTVDPDAADKKLFGYNYQER